jgi:RNA recognition motif-containing protein
MEQEEELKIPFPIVSNIEEVKHSETKLFGSKVDKHQKKSILSESSYEF